MRRKIFDSTHDEFRDRVRAFISRDCLPNFDKWEANRIVDRDAWLAAGRHGFLALGAPKEYGGAGIRDPRFNVIVIEELAAAGLTGFGVPIHNILALPYLLDLATESQKQRWLPGAVRGELVAALAMSEPGAGSDLRGMRTTAERVGDHYVVNGRKAFVANGHTADLILLCCKVKGAAGSSGISILVVERDNPGVERGELLDKVGRHCQDVCDIHFDDARIPVGNLIGIEGWGLGYLMRNLTQERMSVAIASMAGSLRALELTKDYVRDRKAFGQTIGGFQNTRFELADLHARAWMARAYIDACIVASIDGDLTGEDAAAAKLCATELEFACVDAGVQLHGGYGWMNDYPIARMYRDSRVSRILGGSNEIMKEIIGRSLDLEG